ncbi:MAG: carbohydrate-binding family 9-like protein [Acidobacteriota bacterium]
MCELRSLRLALLFAAAASLLFGLPAASQSRKPVYQVPKTTTAIQIDGNLDDVSWSTAPAVTLVQNRDGSPAPYPTEARLLYDDQYLYFAFRCKDENIWATMKQRDEHLWMEEVVEVFVQGDPAHSSYIELEVNPLNAMIDIFLLDIRKPIPYATWNSARLRWNVQVKGTVDGRPGDQEWTCEMALPHEEVVTALHLPPRAGDRWRVNLYRIDQKPKKILLAWSPTLKDDFHVPSMFGEIVFGAGR